MRIRQNKGTIIIRLLHISIFQLENTTLQYKHFFPLLHLSDQLGHAFEYNDTGIKRLNSVFHAGLVIKLFMATDFNLSCTSEVPNPVGI